MNIEKKLEMLLEERLCDSCLGRQFANLLSGYTNAERGRALRLFAAMRADWEGKVRGDFPGITFHNIKKKTRPKGKTCQLCNGFMDDLDKVSGRILKKLGKLDFNTFLIGTKLSSDLLEKEENLWERVGIDFCESIKAEINREVGKRIEKELKKMVDFSVPDVVVLINLEMNKIEININPLYISGYYKKFKRGLPQTKWPSGKYKNSVEEIIARPVMAMTSGKVHKFHGAGREDIDARCLDWRPFILEIVEPKKRGINLKRIQKRINRGKAVKVKDLKFSSTYDVAPLKEKRYEKTYRCIVVVKNKEGIKKEDLKKLRKLVGVIRQKTPQRVLHRRTDLLRKRKVKGIKATFINSKKFRLTVTGEAGLYVKELVSGDQGRSKPSVSEVLGKECVATSLDVVKIHLK